MSHLIIQFLMNGKMHVLYVCGGSESEYTIGRKDFILGPRLEGGGGDNKFSFLFKEEQKNFKAA